MPSGRNDAAVSSAMARKLLIALSALALNNVLGHGERVAEITLSCSTRCAMRLAVAMCAIILHRCAQVMDGTVNVRLGHMARLIRKGGKRLPFS